MQPDTTIVDLGVGPVEVQGTASRHPVEVHRHHVVEDPLPARRTGEARPVMVVGQQGAPRFVPSPTSVGQSESADGRQVAVVPRSVMPSAGTVASRRRTHLHPAGTVIGPAREAGVTGMLSPAACDDHLLMTISIHPMNRTQGQFARRGRRKSGQHSVSVVPGVRRAMGLRLPIRLRPCPTVPFPAQPPTRWQWLCWPSPLSRCSCPMR